MNPKTSFSHLFPGAVTVPAASVPSGPSHVPVAPPFLSVMLKRLPVKPTAPYFQVQKYACPLAIRQAISVMKLSGLLCSVKRDLLQPSKNMFSLEFFLDNQFLQDC